jgi:hypothetical protein
VPLTMTEISRCVNVHREVRMASQNKAHRSRVEHFAGIVNELPPERHRELFPRAAKAPAFRVMWGLLLLLLAVLVGLVMYHSHIAQLGGR